MRPESGPNAFVKYDLNDGSTSVLQIPIELLKKVVPPTLGSPASNKSASPSPPPKAPPSASFDPNFQIKLTGRSGAIFEGRIIRIEKKIVVLQHASDKKVEDIPLETLDGVSREAVGSWKLSHNGQTPEADPRVIPGATITITFPDLGPSYQSDPAKIQVHIPSGYRADQPAPIAVYEGGGKGTESMTS